MKIKGLMLQSRRDYVQDNFGPGAWDRVLKALLESDREQLQGAIFAAQWYPFEIGERVDRAIVKVLGDGESTVFEELGARSAERSLSREYRSFITPGDPQSLMRMAPMIHRRFYDSGRCEYEETGPNSGVMTIYESATYSVPDCLTAIGFIKQGLKMCGAKEIQGMETECRTRGDKVCRYRFEWRI
jgi:uncharacterized protein (TIGR02265 family)